MDQLHIQAALIWAQEHAGRYDSAAEFGRAVALVARACLVTYHHAGDERATAAALAALSVLPETLQAIAHLASLAPASQAVGSTHTGPAGTAGAGQ